MPHIDKRCPACKRLLRRSNPQNSRYWLLLHAMSTRIKAHGKTYSAEVWHVFVKSKFLGCDDITLPNKRTIAIPKSTANLDVAEFNEFMGKVEAFANEHNCWLEDEAFPA